MLPYSLTSIMQYHLLDSTNFPHSKTINHHSVYRYQKVFPRNHDLRINLNKTLYILKTLDSNFKKNKFIKIKYMSMVLYMRNRISTMK